MTSEIQQNRYDRLIRRVAGIIGPGSKVSEVITELFPMIDLENTPNELMILQGTLLGWGGNNLLGSAGNRSTGQLFNPPGSGNLVTITHVIAVSNIDDTLRFQLTTQEMPLAVSVEQQRDTRVAVGERTIAQVRQRLDPTGIGVTLGIPVLANTPLHIQDPKGVWVLGPGSGLLVGTGVNNTNLSFSFFWRERPAEPSELRV